MDMNSLLNSTEYKLIESDIELFVNEKLNNYKPVLVVGKTIHDPIWGSVEYSDWEMQLIDSPLFQRLRDINQVGLAMLTYPSARHSRFEHSLGVVAAAKKMCEKISINSKEYNITDDDKNKVYLATLLHDIGHGFYSHLSERIYGEFKEFDDIITYFNRILKRKPKPHEVLAFIIINTQSFKDFFFNDINYPNKNNCRDFLFHDVGKMIIGANIEKNNRIYSFLTAIINGPFDADKLDYIKRDSHTAGLSLSYDMERLFTKIVVHSMTDDTSKSRTKKIEHRLVVKFNGVTAIEELTFCRIMLFSYIYYHQKVLVSEAMVKDYVYGLYKLGVIKKFSDFLRYTDSEILKLAKNQDKKSPFPEYALLDLQNLSYNISCRRLPKRCFEISQTNVEYIDEEQGFDLRHYSEVLAEKCKKGISTDDLIDSIESMANSLIMQLTRETPLYDSLISDFREATFEKLLDLRNNFFKHLVSEYNNSNKSVDFTMFDVYIIFPQAVSYGAAEEDVILGRDNINVLKINEFVNLSDWADSFNSNKWRGYVFISEHIDRTLAFRAAEKFILGGKAKIKNPSAYLKVNV